MYLSNQGNNFNKIELYIGLSILGLGFLYYYLFRYTYITEPFAEITVNNNLPSFFHACSFALISSSFCESNNKNKAIVSWVIINMVFELMQLWNMDNKLYFFSNFINGSFDAGDIFASIGGGLCAWLITQFT